MARTGPKPDSNRSGTHIASDFITLSGTFFYLGTDVPVSFLGSQPFTIEGWVGFDSLDSAAPIFSRAGEIVVGLTDAGRFFVRRRFCEAPLISSTRLAAGTWHHFGITCDGKTWRLYLDGDHHAERNGIVTDEVPHNLGNLKRSSSLGCEIWNLRIWNRAQSQEQLRQAMRSLMAPQNGLVASFFPEIPTASRLRLDSSVNPALKASAA